MSLTNEDSIYTHKDSETAPAQGVDVQRMVRQRYWVCIIGPVDKGRLPNGFDSLPRIAAIEAIEKAGIEVKDCWSGWDCDEKHFKDIAEVWNRE